MTLNQQLHAMLILLVARRAWFAALVSVSLIASVTVSGWSPRPARAAGPCDPPVTNPIPCENSQTGTDPAVWSVTHDSSIVGFANDISVNRGGSIAFKVKTDAKAYGLTIFRLGYYGGMGARLVASVAPSAPLPQQQPACLTDASTGLVDCGNWAVSASWNVPATAVSGIYIAKLQRTDTGGSNQITFVVRNDSSTSDLFFQTSDTTWQAYNDWGGNNLYGGSGPASDGRAYKVSYNRPFTTDVTKPDSWLFNTEYPMLRWLEANGYNVSYTTGIDSDRQGSLIRNHRAFLSVGHDEYWSAGQRANVEAARNAGVNLAFFSGNEVFWKTRWDKSIDSSGTAYRTLVSYKETHANAVIDPADPPTWTGTWRDPRFSPPADGGKPENSLTGTIFMVNGTDYRPVTVSAAEGKMRFWRNTSAANLAAGQSVSYTAGCSCLVGYEWDEDLDNGSRPPGLFQLSTTTANVQGLLVDYGSTFQSGQATHHLTLYRHPSGALVFGAGSVSWAYGLDGSSNAQSSQPDINIQQATVNLFADMGVQPSTLQASLVAAAASTDTAPPTSTITSPTSGASVTGGSQVTVTGTAIDPDGGVVAGVEVSVDSGSTWHPATGRGNWSYTWTPGTPGQVTLKSRAVDDSGNLETPSSGVTIAVNPPNCPCSIWSTTATPSNPATSDVSAVELGVKFTSDVNAYIGGVRFYKASTNTGTHVGNLWSSSGTLLASATFTGETASGWQQVVFANPVAITPGTTYVASYHTNVGHYSQDLQYFAATGVDNYPLHAPSSGKAGGNGVFSYSAGSTFPNQTYNASNYWVDVVLTNPSPDTAPPVVVNRAPAPGSTGVPVTTSVSAAFSKPVNASSISFILKDATGSTVPSTVTYNSSSLTATLQPNSALGQGITYTATVSGATDSSGRIMTPTSWSFTTFSNTCPCSLWSTATTPSNPSSGDTSAVELGVKFKSDVGGYISGLRFYKGSANTGTHVGSLWTTTGTLLTSATFSNETASGWQQVNFPAPVAISANTTYVASYHTNVGHYAVDLQYFSTNGTDLPPLHAPSSAAAGGNGVYSYGSGSTFPNQTYNGSNYWVDVVFATSDQTPPIVTAQSPAPNATGVSLVTPVTATFSKPVAQSSISFALKDTSGSTVPSTVSYNSSSMTATLQPNNALGQGITYTATLSGATDSSGNVMAPTSWSFTTFSNTCPCSLWSASAAPVNPASSDASAVEVGVKFTSEINGYISAIRFYKGSTNTGTHVGSLWSAAGTLLTNATFTNETASGWQQVNFLTPVAISANTTYVASYHTNVGHYAQDSQYFSNSSVDVPPLHAPSSAAAGGNGVYSYGSGSTFPNQTYNATNYWVDVVFTTTTSDKTPPTLTSQSPASNATAVALTTAATATFSKPVTPSSISFVLRDPANNVIPASLTYNSTNLTATLQPNAQLTLNTRYTATVSGAADLSGNVMAPATWAFTTVACPCSIWSPSATPGTPSAADSNQVEVGVKFRSDVNGSITGVRFYKGATNTGTHVAHLWTSTGTLLATATFTAETASGWQQVNFPTPVPITANTVYVASYYTSSGNYERDGGFFAASGVDNAPLHALSNAAGNGDGVYAYGANATFPNQTYNATNYWVDVVFGT